MPSSGSLRGCQTGRTQKRQIPDAHLQRKLMREMRAQKLRLALSEVATETVIGLHAYAKSNTLSPDMMTAGQVLFPRVKPDEFDGPFEIDIDIGSHRFAYVGG